MNKEDSNIKDNHFIIIHYPTTMFSCIIYTLGIITFICFVLQILMYMLYIITQSSIEYTKFIDLPIREQILTLYQNWSFKS